MCFPKIHGVKEAAVLCAVTVTSQLLQDTSVRLAGINIRAAAFRHMEFSDERVTLKSAALSRMDDRADRSDFNLWLNR